MRLRNIILTGMVLLVLALTTVAGATDQNATGNETKDVNVTGTPTETLTATPTPEDDGESYKGIFGPGHLLYRLQIAFENMDEVFTYNVSEKLGKQVSHARKRIAQARAALRSNDTEAADKALAEYRVKVSDVNRSISKLSDKDTGVINAQKMILKHQAILENLSISHPDNKGLQRAYNNSKNLQVKMDSRIEQTSNIKKGNQETMKAEKSREAVQEEKPGKGKKSN